MGVARYSTGYRNFRLRGGSFQQAFQNGQIEGYSSTMPTSADSATSGSTKLVTITAGSATRTAEVRASATVTLATGAAGSVDNIKVTAAAIDLLCPNQFSAAVPVAFNTSLTQTAADCVTQINKGTWWHGYEATSSGAVITVKPLPGLGDSINTADITATCTTITTTDVDFAGGVDPANGLQFGATASGAMSKSGTWSGVGAVAGTIGWVRFIGSEVDAGGASTTLIRMDMDAATAAAFFEMSSTVVAVGATITCDTGTFTEQSTVTG